MVKAVSLEMKMDIKPECIAIWHRSFKEVLMLQMNTAGTYLYILCTRLSQNPCTVFFNEHLWQHSVKRFSYLMGVGGKVKQGSLPQFGLSSDPRKSSRFVMLTFYLMWASWIRRLISLATEALATLQQPNPPNPPVCYLRCFHYRSQRLNLGHYNK